MFPIYVCVSDGSHLFSAPFAGMNSSQCQGNVTAQPGYYYPAGATQLTGYICPMGIDFYCPITPLQIAPLFFFADTPWTMWPVSGLLCQVPTARVYLLPATRRRFCAPSVVLATRRVWPARPVRACAPMVFNATRARSWPTNRFVQGMCFP
jgi:hypothetical protein